MYTSNEYKSRFMKDFIAKKKLFNFFEINKFPLLNIFKVFYRSLSVMSCQLFLVDTQVRHDGTIS